MYVQSRMSPVEQLKEVLVQLRMSGSCRANIFRGVVFGAGLGPAENTLNRPGRCVEQQHGGRALPLRTAAARSLKDKKSLPT
jgi:hypothetical protein